MPRTSKRLAKKGKRVKADTGKSRSWRESLPLKVLLDEIHDDLGRDPSFEDVDSEQEDQQPPPRKRQRAAARPAKAITRKKQVRGKQGRLAGLVNMPIDIFTEVASHLLPGDIISLARSNKFFRNLLMHRSAIHIWHGAMRNVEGLPPCPPDMSEPHYLALLFSKTCTACGAPVRVSMDPVLLVRLCGPCRITRLMPLDAVPAVLHSWLLASASTSPPKQRSAGLHVLREEVSSLLAQYEGKKRSKDKTALDVWIKQREEIVGTRREQTLVLNRFMIALERDRERELSDAKGARRSEITRRLAEMGWTAKDMEFGWWSDQQRTRAWRNLVSQAKPLTDRIWANLQPKLIPLLEVNREERLSVERKTRKMDRQDRLAELFDGIKEKDPLVLKLKASNPVLRLSSTMPTISFTYRGPFPNIGHTLDWLVVKNLYETDSSVEEMEANFETHREEIEGLITEWRNQIHTQLASLLRDGYESQGEVLRPTVAVLNNDPDPLANMSDDLKLLIRGDSFFRKSVSPDYSTQPLSYGTILSTERLTGALSAFGPIIHRPAPSLDHLHWYPEAHEVARELLADLGRPDASYLEMKGVGAVFVCGRCHENDVRNWEGMVQHYVEQKQLYAKIEEDETCECEGITYNNVHDPSLFTDRPMITDYATKTLENDAGIGRLQICKVCEEIPVAKNVIAPKSAILNHLLDVHEIADPEPDEHYAPRGLIDSGLFGISGYDSDESCDMGYGCDCPFHTMFGAYDDYYDDHYDDDGIDPGNIYFYDDEDEDDGEDDEDDDGGYWCARSANRLSYEIKNDVSHDFNLEPAREQENSPRKRQRATTKSTEGVTRKKQVRGKQGSLTGLISMSIDIFTEVASHLLLGDIISLDRSNKFFRNLLMHRSAIHIWHGTMKNVEGPPSCPPDMSEPHDLALLFSKTCSMCGGPVRVRMDPIILIRLCGPCRNTHLMPIEAVLTVLMTLVSHSAAIAPPKRRSENSFLLREDFNDVLTQYEEKTRSGDDVAFGAWIKKRKEIIDKRRTEAQVLFKFLDALEVDRGQVLVDTKAARRSKCSI
ncbi:unnamed protein product [Rhizoctonia solani]|uniref:F-box domain-containing protein n=1 Tax=Rhizoctonia solani TaxID=456999 RepID=A0A8H3HR26_9AGAM|nr:unnamed protein product [Rhizoctonia solani]